MALAHRLLHASAVGPRFPNALTTGPAAGGYGSLTPNAATSLQENPPYPSWVTVQGDGSLLVQGQDFNSGNTLVVNPVGKVIFRGCRFRPAATFYTVQPGVDAAGPFIFEYCQASSIDSTAANAVYYGFPLPPGSVVRRCDLSWYVAQPVITDGNGILIDSNYIHDIVFLDTAHAEPLYFGPTTPGGSQSDVTVINNTLLPGTSDTLTAAIYMDAHGHDFDSFTITGNLLAGGSYPLYLGAFSGFTDTNLVVEDNWFSTAYYPGGGAFGYAANAPAWGSGGNSWAGNRWYDGPLAGQLISAP